MGPSNFKVIIVGGGPVGLTAAHILEKAGFDFLLLERRPNVVIDAGSNLVLQANGMSVLSQLGLLKSIEAVSTPLGVIDRINHKGRSIGDANWFVFMKQNSGKAPLVISRHDLTKVLYDTLRPESQAKILPGKKLSSISTTQDGVNVTCANGTSHEGSMVIGADGAHSVVRDLMQRLASDAGATDPTAESPFLTTYKALWVRFPSSAKILPGTTCETHGPLVATQLFAGEDTGVIGVYERLPEPTRERIRHTVADQDALVERWGHLPVTSDGLTSLRDLYTARLEAGLVSLEEGVVEQWSWDGRIVLAGDAAHKLTPSTGAGCNNGMVDIVALVNELHSAVERGRSTSRDPSRAELTCAFTAYQDRRFAAIVDAVSGSSQATASATWQTGIHKFVDQHVISRKALQKFLFSRGTKGIAHTTAIDFLQAK